VPIRWRRLVALHVYTYARAGEVEALHVEDVDLRHRVIHVHRAIDRRKGGEKEVKTNMPRKFAIEPELLPLLERLVADAHAEGAARLVQMPPLPALAPRLRLYLQRAGITRAELFADDETRKRLTFHDLRATGITWMAIRGDEPLHIMHRAGHEQMSTTMGYVREAESVEYLRSEVFPALPEAIILPEFLPVKRGRPALPRGIIEQSSGSSPARCPASI
jgi:integrase